MILAKRVTRLTRKVTSLLRRIELIEEHLEFNELEDLERRIRHLEKCAILKDQPS